MDGLVVSARSGTIYAFKKTNAVNVGAVEAYKSEFRGVVAGTQGIGRWIVENCKNDGLDDGDGNVPYRLLEADGIARTFSNLSVKLFGDWSGAVSFAKGAGSIASAAPLYLDVNANVWPSATEPVGSTPSPRSFSLLMVVGAATATLAPTAGEVAISVKSHDGQGATTPGFASNVALLRGRGLTGSGTLTLGSSTSTTALDVSGFIGNVGVATVDGSASMTGTLTVNGTSGVYITGGMGSGIAAVRLNSAITTGSVTVSNDSYFVKNAGSFSGIYFAAAQTSSTPAVTVSATFDVVDVEDVSVFSISASVSVGTWTYSGSIFGDSASTYTCALTGSVSGGTWTMSGNVWISLHGTSYVQLGVAASFATGGTLTVSGQFYAEGGIHASIRNCHARAAGASVTRSGSSFFRNMGVYNSFGFVFSENGTGGSPTSAVNSGGIFCYSTIFEQADALANNVVRAAGANDAATGPSQVSFEFCRWDGEGLNTQSGAGTITWAAGTIPFYMDHCSMLGTFTIVGTPFSLFEVFESTFYGAISFSGSRPATRYAWFKCSFQTTFLDTTGKPDILDDYFIIANDGNAKVQGQLAIIGSTPSAVDPASSTDTIEGVVFEAVGANTNPVTLIRRGCSNVRVETSVAAGDNLVARVSTDLTEAITGTSGTGVGRRIGRALTADDGGSPDRAYTAINLM
jgi:hypothetical protein